MTDTSTNLPGKDEPDYSRPSGSYEADDRVLVSEAKKNTRMAQAQVLIVDDEQLIRWSIRQKLQNWGFRVVEAEDGVSAFAALEKVSPDIVLLDVRLPDTTGIEILKRIRDEKTDSVVIMMTGYGVLEDAVECLRLGAYDFISKPLNFDELHKTLENAADARRMRQTLHHFRDRDRRSSRLETLVGQSESFKASLRLAEKVASSPTSTILLQGESGTGKDLFAKVIHYQSSRADAGFLAVNCAALPEHLVESELFGHEKGAFTDASRRKPGLFELADGGTLFLDEIGEMPLGLQAKLLRVLEEQVFRRVGGTDDVAVDVRIIAATNRPLSKMVEEDKFRPDLFYRLNVIAIELPPLRERGSDALLLARHYVDVYNAKFGKSIEGLDPEGEQLLTQYHWPGNVRELRNVIERAMLLEDGPLVPAEELRLDVHPPSSSNGAEVALPSLELPADGTSLESVEKEFLRLALQRTNGNQTKAAELLRISRDTLRYKMKKHRLD